MDVFELLKIALLVPSPLAFVQRSHLIEYLKYFFSFLASNGSNPIRIKTEYEKKKANKGKGPPH